MQRRVAGMEGEELYYGWSVYGHSIHEFREEAIPRGG